LKKGEREERKLELRESRLGDTKKKKCPEPGCSGIVTAEQQSCEDENATIRMQQHLFRSLIENLRQFRITHFVSLVSSPFTWVSLCSSGQILFSERAVQLFGKNRDHVFLIWSVQNFELHYTSFLPSQMLPFLGF
jgi:hypothetical protein